MENITLAARRTGRDLGGERHHAATMSHIKTPKML
jgi:hypothetical protein